jgi:hypothetical protein
LPFFDRVDVSFRLQMGQTYAPVNGWIIHHRSRIFPRRSGRGFLFTVSVISRIKSKCRRGRFILSTSLDWEGAEDLGSFSLRNAEGVILRLDEEDG